MIEECIEGRITATSYMTEGRLTATEESKGSIRSIKIGDMKWIVQDSSENNKHLCQFLRRRGEKTVKRI